jgi:PST family polysaccharide transporter
VTCSGYFIGSSARLSISEALLTPTNIRIFSVGASFGLKTLIGFITVKTVATHLGAHGIAALGQFNNIILIVATLAGGGLLQGVIQRLGSVDKGNTQQDVLDSAHGYSIQFMIAATCIGILASPLVARLLPIPDATVVIFALLVSQYAFYRISILHAVLVHHGRQDLYAAGQLFTGLATLLATTVGISIAGLTGALLGFLFGASSNWLILSLLARQYINELAQVRLPKRTREDHRYWGRFSIVAATSAFAMPLAYLLIRSYVVSQSGWEMAGLWQAVLRISDTYIYVLVAILTSVYFPYLVSAGSTQKRVIVMTKFAAVILVPLAALEIAIFAFRTELITLIFSPEFGPASALVLPQLLGDLLRVATYLLTFFLLSEAKLHWILLTELFGAFLFWVLAISSFDLGLIAVGWSYAAMNAIVLMVAILLTYAVLAKANPSAS